MIRVKIINILIKKERNLRWLSLKTKLNYSTLYNFAHNKTSAVSYEILEKLCDFFKCSLEDIIEYIPDDNNK